MADPVFTIDVLVTSSDIAQTISLSSSNRAINPKFSDDTHKDQIKSLLVGQWLLGSYDIIPIVVASQDAANTKTSATSAPTFLCMQLYYTSTVRKVADVYMRWLPLPTSEYKIVGYMHSSQLARTIRVWQKTKSLSLAGNTLQYDFDYDQLAHSRPEVHAYIKSAKFIVDEDELYRKIHAVHFLRKTLLVTPSVYVPPLDAANNFRDHIFATSITRGATEEQYVELNRIAQPQEAATSTKKVATIDELTYLRFNSDYHNSFLHRALRELYPIIYRHAENAFPFSAPMAKIYEYAISKLSKKDLDLIHTHAAKTKNASITEKIPINDIHPNIVKKLGLAFAQLVNSEESDVTSNKIFEDVHDLVNILRNDVIDPKTNKCKYCKQHILCAHYFDFYTKFAKVRDAKSVYKEIVAKYGAQYAGSADIICTVCTEILQRKFEFDVVATPPLSSSALAQNDPEIRDKYIIMSSARKVLQEYTTMSSSLQTMPIVGKIIQIVAEITQSKLVTQLFVSLMTKLNVISDISRHTTFIQFVGAAYAFAFALKMSFEAREVRILDGRGAQISGTVDQKITSIIRALVNDLYGRKFITELFAKSVLITALKDLQHVKFSASAGKSFAESAKVAQQKLEDIVYKVPVNPHIVIGKLIERSGVTSLQLQHIRERIPDASDAQILHALLAKNDSRRLKIFPGSTTYRKEITLPAIIKSHKLSLRDGFCPQGTRHKFDLVNRKYVCSICEQSPRTGDALAEPLDLAQEINVYKSVIIRASIQNFRNVVQTICFANNKCAHTFVDKKCTACKYGEISEVEYLAKWRSAFTEFAESTATNEVGQTSVVATTDTPPQFDVTVSISSTKSIEAIKKFANASRAPQSTKTFNVFYLGCYSIMSVTAIARESEPPLYNSDRYAILINYVRYCVAEMSAQQFRDVHVNAKYIEKYAAAIARQHPLEQCILHLVAMLCDLFSDNIDFYTQIVAQELGSASSPELAAQVRNTFNNAKNQDALLYDTTVIDGDTADAVGLEPPTYISSAVGYDAEESL